ncbi:IMP dehydrogenase, partial [Candidatus Woesearchaeota archaeon]|nr:IMP dehydrogenase [Candidatus Woesearchaeota archaeon]
MVQEIKEALTYEDVLLIPNYSTISSRKHVDISTHLTPKIKLNIPMVSGNMESVTESKMAIAMARLGGIGIIHRYMTVQDQVNEILKVKRAEAIVIERPLTLTPDRTLKDASLFMQEHGINGLLITDAVGRFQGILTRRDMLFEENLLLPISDAMTAKKDAVTAEYGIDIDAAKNILKVNKVEKLPLLDKNGSLKGL